MALHDASPNNIQTWRTEYAPDVVLLLDNTSSVYNTFKLDNSRPQYVVMDQDMRILFKGRGTTGSQEAKEVILSILNEE